MELKEEKKLKKNLHRFFCESCDFKCYMKCDWERHIIRPKHVKGVKEGAKGMMGNEKNVKKTYCCKNCDKHFVTQSGLWKHNLKCEYHNTLEDTNALENIKNNEINQQQLVEYLMKENSEFKQLMIDQNKQMLELAKNAGNHNTNSNVNINTNNSNNSFNLNVFLNETCKDAMNIMEFVDQLQVSVKDLEETGRLGYSEGISKIFINGLKQINISDRPIHCADSKREIVYIKDKNQWTKEDGDKSLLTNAIKHVAHKNMRQIKEWTKVNPEYNDSSSKQNDRYLKIVSNSMNGSTEEETNKNYNKIIKNITKETVIEK
jgi:hypothetical protein